MVNGISRKTGKLGAEQAHTSKCIMMLLAFSAEGLRRQGLRPRVHLAMGILKSTAVQRLLLMRRMNSWKSARLSGSVLCCVAMLIVLAFVACTQGHDKQRKRKPGSGFQLTSDAFDEGKHIPAEYACDGANSSPPLVWTGAPAGAKSFALICEDKDAASGIFVHWVIYNIPGGTTGGLPAQLPPDAALSDGIKQGKNSFNKIGYGGPCPPPGQSHRYFFRLYALDALLSPIGNTRADIDKAMEGHILAEKDLMGTY